MVESEVTLLVEVAKLCRVWRPKRPLRASKLAVGCMGERLAKRNTSLLASLDYYMFLYKKSGIPSGGIPFWQDFLNKAKFSFGGTQVRWDSY